MPGWKKPGFQGRNPVSAPLSGFSQALIRANGLDARGFVAWRVEPADYAAWREFCMTMDQKLAEKIRISK